MKNQIESIINQVKAHVDYIYNNKDYVEQYIIMIADDSVYHNDSYIDAIKFNASDDEKNNLDNDAIEYVKDYIIENVEECCNIEIKNALSSRNENTITSFNINEVEVQIVNNGIAFDNEIVKQLNQESDYTFKLQNGNMYAYVDMTYDVVTFTLKDNIVDEILKQYKEENE